MIELINYERLVDGCLDRKYELAQILALARLQVSPPAPRRPASTRAGKRTKRRLVQRIPRDPDAAAHKPIMRSADEVVPIGKQRAGHVSVALVVQWSLQRQRPLQSSASTRFAPVLSAASCRW